MKNFLVLSDIGFDGEGFIDKADAEKIIKHLQDVFGLQCKDKLLKDLLMTALELEEVIESERGNGEDIKTLLANRNLAEATLNAVDYLNITTNDLD